MNGADVSATPALRCSDAPAEALDRTILNLGSSPIAALATATVSSEESSSITTHSNETPSWLRTLRRH